MRQSATWGGLKRGAARGDGVTYQGPNVGAQDKAKNGHCRGRAEGERGGSLKGVGRGCARKGAEALVARVTDQ